MRSEAFRNPDDGSRRLRRETLRLAMLFGIPVAATIQARRRDRFQSLAWTEWLSMVCGTVIGTTLLMLAVLHDFDWQSTSWMAERIVGVLGLASVAVLCWMVLSRCSRYLHLVLQPPGDRSAS